MKRENSCQIKRQILAKDRVYRESTLKLSQHSQIYDSCPENIISWTYPLVGL